MRPVWWRVLDLFPDTGPCCLCGHRMGARHRMADAVLERLRAGEVWWEVAEDFGLEPEVLAAAWFGEEP